VTEMEREKLQAWWKNDIPIRQRLSGRICREIEPPECENV